MGKQARRREDSRSHHVPPVVLRALRSSIDAEQGQEGRQQNDALILHDASEGNRVPIDGHESRCKQADTGSEGSAAQHKEGHQGSEVGQGKGKTSGPLVDATSDCVGGCRQQDLDRPLLVEEEHLVMPLKDLGSSEHGSSLVALELGIAQVDEPKKRRNDYQE